MAENYKGRERRYFFSRGQMVLLGSAFTVASVLIFLLGVYVGKGIEQQKVAKAEDTLVRIPIGPLTSGAAGVGAKPDEKITFYETLTNAPKADPKSADEKPQKQVKAVQPEVKERAKAPGKANESEEKPKPAKKAEADKADTGSSAKDDSGDKSWTVQVNAFPDERSAQVWVDRLKKKGYNAYITEITNRGKTWYRVRVGRYGTREEAENAEEVLKSKENFVKAFATSR